MNRNRNHLGAMLLLCLSAAASLLSAAETGSTSPDAMLNDVLQRTRHSAGSFWGQFTSVACVEKVTQAKLGQQGKIEQAQKSTFDYLAILNAENGGLSVEESRVQQGKPEKPKKVPLLITNGISTLLLVFHSNYRNSFRYELDGEEIAGGQKLLKIRFKHIPGTRSTAALRLRDTDYPLEIEGTAWVNPEAGVIHRIVAGLAAPMSSINLKSLQMEVFYAPQTFAPGSDSYWLPLTAAVDIRTERQHWHNIHQYSNYRRFTVNTEDRILP